MLTGISDFHSYVEWGYHTSTSSPSERIYLSGTGIDNTKTWVFSVLRDRIDANGKRSRFPVTGNYRDSENIPTVDGIP